MSAITGIYYRDGRKVDEEQIKKMNDCLSHRGPDGSAVWCEGSVGLGHQMLYTTPESLHEKLPFEEDGLVITADARIDNRKELSEKLGVEDKKEVSDSYFILKAYQKWGEKCPEELLGDFAFAIWDKEKEELFCVRDHMGIKPLFYFLSDELFLFSTEIKAIFSIPEVPRRIDEDRVAQYLISMQKDPEITFYKGITRLTPASSIKICINGFNLEKYWSLNPNFEQKLESDAEYIKKFQEIFKEAVRCRMRSAFPLGSLLSGGLDSSSIVCVAREILLKNDGEPLKTFSAIFEDKILSGEKDYIKAVVDGGHIKPYYVRVDEVGPLDDYEKILCFEDEVVSAPNLFMPWLVVKKAKKEDVRILLEGFGGDSVIFGKGYLEELLMKGKIKSLIRELKASSKLRKTNPYKQLIAIVLQIIAPITSYKIAKYRKENTLYPKQRKRIIEDKFAHKMQIDKVINSKLKKVKKTLNPRIKHYFELNSNKLVSWWEAADIISASYNIESRYPFLDKRLLEYCLSLPTEQKIKNGWSRIILRKAMDNIIPPKIQWRPKKVGMGQNFRKNLLLYNQELIEEIVYGDHDLIKDYVDMDVLRESYEIYKKTGLENKRAIRNVWRAVTLCLWLRSKKEFFKSENYNK